MATSGTAVETRPTGSGSGETDAFRPRAFGKRASRVLHAYYRGPDHPMKLRLWWAFRRLVNHRRIIVPYAGDGWLSVDERDFLQGEIFARGAYEPEVWEALAAHARSAEVVWDIGANIGSFSVRAMLDPRVAVVHAFEPDPVSAGILRFNLGLNRGAFQVHGVGLGDTQEVRVLHRGPSANSGLTGFDNPLSHARFQVQCELVDGLVFEQGIAAPTLIKLDVEGWEERVLQGARRLLAERPPRAIAFEAECDAEGALAVPGIATLLAGFGYRVERIARPDGTVEERENYLAVRHAAR